MYSKTEIQFLMSVGMETFNVITPFLECGLVLTE